MKCRHCSGYCNKAGFQRNGIQKYRCKVCERYQQAVYAFKDTVAHFQDQIVKLYKEGVGVRGMARLLHVSPASILRHILKIKESCKPPMVKPEGGIYEVDELWTYVGSKQHEVWIAYAMNRATKQVVDFTVGQRNKQNLEKIVKTVLQANPTRICTDGLNIYPTLIPKRLHAIGLPHTRHIERHNLTLRSRLKRLQRKTIGFSRSVTQLQAALSICFWSSGKPLSLTT